MPSDIGFCLVHGETEVRGHRKKSKGRVSINWVCPACHTEVVKAYRDGYQTGLSQTVPKCLEKRSSDGIKCDRPNGHPLDVHRAKNKVTWKVAP